MGRKRAEGGGGPGKDGQLVVIQDDRRAISRGRTYARKWPGFSLGIIQPTVPRD